MSILELWLLAVALAMDCFTVSIVFGVLLRKIEWRTILVVAFLFGLFQVMMPLAGWLATNSFSSLIEDYDHWIAKDAACVCRCHQHRRFGSRHLLHLSWFQHYFFIIPTFAHHRFRFPCIQHRW